MKSRWLGAALLLLSLAALHGQDKKKPAPKDTPRVLFSLPLGIPAGPPTRVVLRGLKLDAASAVRTSAAGVTVKLLSKGKAAVPNQQDAGHVGDSQVEVELTVPKEFAGKPLPLVVVTPAGESSAYELIVNGPEPVVAEKEPNDGFPQAQKIAVPQVVDGKIDHPLDVDVFRFDGKAGQALAIEIQAARHGSPLDSLLLLHDSDGRLLASNDDLPGSPDSRIEATLPRDGAYFVSVIDANDQGSPLHIYRLVVRPR